MKTAKVQALVNWSIEPAQAILVKNARQMGITVPIFQSHGFGNMAYVKAAGRAAEGVIFPGSRILVADALPKGNIQKDVIIKYKKDYEAMYREDVSAFGGYAYDAFMILISAINRGGADRNAIRASIENTKRFVGTSGVFSFSPADHNGLDINAFEMLTVRNGKFAIFNDTAVTIKK
jgi:branched-chain amino acid transport system substrate-binding protein